MSKYDAINQGILNNDIRALREALGNICYADAGFKTNDFADALAEIKEHNIAIKDPSLVGDLISTQKTQFANEDLTRAIFKLKRNFCDERIEDVKVIGTALNPVKTQANNVNQHQDILSNRKYADPTEGRKALIGLSVAIASLVVAAGTMVISNKFKSKKVN